MTRRRIGAAILGCLAYGSDAVAQEATWANRAGDLRVEARVYVSSSGDSIQGEEGWFAVPENRGAPGSRSIEVHYVRLRSSAPDPGTPVVYLAGGPGNSGTGDLRSGGGVAFWAQALEVGDVILVDQRGVLDPALRWAWDGPPDWSFFRDYDTARDHYLEVARRAPTAVRARGVDLDGYTTRENARDFDELRQALGIDRWSLLAFSYGTHLALAVVRDFGDHVANVIFIGTEGPDHTLKRPLSFDAQMGKVALAASRDERIRAEVPDLVELFRRVTRKLDAEPMVVEIDHPRMGLVKIPVGGFGLQLIMRQDLGDATDLPVFPRLLYSIDQGDPSVLAWFVAKRLGFMTGAATMSLNIDLASWASPERLAVIAAEELRTVAPHVVNFPLDVIQDTWGTPSEGYRYHDPVVSDARALFISGQYDWNSPPYQAEEVRFGFPNSTQLIVPNAGHEQTFFQTPGAFRVAVDFLKGEDVTGTVLRYRPLRFVPLTGTDPEVSHPSVGGTTPTRPESNDA